ncbi:MAG: regulatory protein RecX [Spirochaetota bacterium]
MRVWEEAPFHEGDRLPAEAWERILSRTNLIRARGQALSLLARAEHSRFLLRQKLLQRGHEPSSIEPALDSLEADGSLCDERFASSWVRSRLRSHPEGRSHLVAGLRSRGIDGALADRIVDAVLEDESISLTETARDLAARLTRRRSLGAEKLADRLYRRGFSSAVVRTVVAEFSDPADPSEAHEETP